MFVDLVGADARTWPGTCWQLPRRRNGVLQPLDSYGLRFVTHLNVDVAGVDHAAACIREFFTAG